MILVNLLLLVFGLALLVKGADFFTEGAASLAKRLGVSELIIGLTIVAVGTSIPEFASSIVAAVRGQNELVIGNIVGSNIFNICFILGLSAIVRRLNTTRQMLERDGYVMLATAVVFYALALDGLLSRVDCALLLLLYIAYALFLISTKDDTDGRYRFKEFLAYFFRFRYLITIRDGVTKGINSRRELAGMSREQKAALVRHGIIRDLAIMAVSLVAIILGAKYLVDEAIFFADVFGISKAVIGLLVIAAGTSLPELSVSVVAAKKGYSDIAIGNIVGSNIANILLILGTTGLMYPISVIKGTLLWSAPIMVLASLILLVFIRSGLTLGRREGVFFVVFYALFLAAVFLGLVS